MTAIGEVPTDPDAIDAQWLTWALRSSGMLTSGSVSDVRVEPVSGSGGFAGQLRRLHVSYQGLVDEAPSSIVMKLHSPDESTRALIWRLRAAEREIRFYREFAVDAGVPTALMYFAELQGQRYVILLEDLAPACAGDLLAEIHPEEIYAAVACVAGMHARWWQKKRLRALGWIPSFDELTAIRHEISRDAWPEFIERYAGQLPRGFEMVGSSIMDGLDHVRSVLGRVPATVLHGDFRPDNVMFPAVGGGGPVALIDWQVMLYGPAVADVAYYLTSAVPRRVRCQLEAGVLRRYHAALVDEGVSDYSFGCCFDHYRLAIADLLSRVVVLTTRIQPEGPSRSKAFEVLAERVAGAVVDLNCAARLESAP